MAEHSSILEGTCYAAFGVEEYDDSKLGKYTAGAWFSTPVGMPHYALTKEEYCIIEIHVLGPWGVYFCNPKDHPHS